MKRCLVMLTLACLALPLAALRIGGGAVAAAQPSPTTRPDGASGRAPTPFPADEDRPRDDDDDDDDDEDDGRGGFDWRDGRRGGSDGRFGDRMRGGPGGPGAGGGPGADMRGSRPFGWSPEEQRRALSFARDHMPVLYQMIDEAERNSPRHRRLMRFALERYRWAQRIEREEPELYPQVLQRLRSQDEVFDLVKRYKLSGEPQQREQIREELRAKVREIVLNWLEERQRRIEHLRSQLDREVRQLEEDQAKVDELTSQRTERLLSELDDLRPRGAGEESEAPRIPPDERGPATAPRDR